MKRLYTLTKKFGKYFIIVFLRHGYKSHLSLQRNHERSQEQEKIEKQRQMPFHMHINLEMLECVYLVSAMLIEIPYMAAHEFDARRRMISKSYYQQLRYSLHTRDTLKLKVGRSGTFTYNWAIFFGG